MQAAAVAEVANTLGGVWELERSENVQEYLAELGVGDCERKKYADDTKLNQSIKVNGDVIQLELDFGYRYFNMEFRLNEQFEIRAGKNSKAIARWKNGVLVLDVTRVDNGRLQVIERKLEDGKLVQTMTSNGVWCRRYFKRSS